MEAYKEQLRYPSLLRSIVKLDLCEGTCFIEHADNDIKVKRRNTFMSSGSSQVAAQALLVAASSHDNNATMSCEEHEIRCSIDHGIPASRKAIHHRNIHLAVHHAHTCRERHRWSTSFCSIFVVVCLSESLSWRLLWLCRRPAHSLAMSVIC